MVRFLTSGKLWFRVWSIGKPCWLCSNGRRDAIGDPSFSGAVYDADEGADVDDVPNYLDAFPDAADKSVDADYSDLVMQDYPGKGTIEN